MSDTGTATGWEAHEREQLQARLRLSYRERIDWLWQAKLFAERARQSVRERREQEAKRQP
jgi:hypothetical protein